MSPSEVAPAAAPKPYVAIVVFHGMGQQRHLETIAELAESLDDFVFSEHRRAPNEFRGTRLMRKTRREKVRTAADAQTAADEVVYIQADYDSSEPTSRVRIYEGYWAPATVDGTSAYSAFWWLIRQLPRPLKVLCAPWRAYSRLRRADLLAMAFAKPLTEGSRPPPGFAALVDIYARFANRRPPESGSFRSFLMFVRERISDAGQRAQALAIARTWWLRHVLRQCGDALTLLGVGLAIAAGAVLLGLGIILILQFASGWLGSFDSGSWLHTISGEVKPDLKTASAFAAFILAAFGVAGFLRDAVGDVQQFVTYEEAESLHVRREKILSLAECTLRQVLTDTACERVVIIAHSLGTAVALDTILRLRAANQAESPSSNSQVHMDEPLALNKIQHFVTCGSPIDKITYFFATLRSMYRSYESMVDDLRGDIGDIPFSRSGKQPYMHWVNFWDRGDPVSGPLHTVASADELRIQRVDNVRVASYLWPDPGASHAAYFVHRDMIECIYKSAFCNYASFATPPRVPAPAGGGERPVYVWQGPGKASHLQSVLLVSLPLAILLMIWTTAGLLIDTLPSPSVTQLGAAIGVLVAGAIIQRVFRLHRVPVNRVSAK